MVTSGKAHRAEHRRLRVAAAALGAMAAAGILWAVLERFDPLPPRHVVMVTGAPGSGYEVAGKQYRAVLARHGIDLELRNSDGDAANFSQLTDPQSDADIALLLGGLPNLGPTAHLESLGTMFVQPLWLFYRTADRAAPVAFNELAGLRLSVGNVGSGTHALTMALLQQTGTAIDPANLRQLPPDVAASQLIGGQIDVAAVVTSWDAPSVQRLLKTPGIGLVALRRVDALVELNPHLEKVVLSEGAGDLKRNHPPADVALLAGKSSLIVRRSLHPAIRYLLLEAAEQIHAKPSVFNGGQRYPAAEAIDIALCDEAKAYHKSGRPIALQYLPFWLAALVQRAVLVLVPLLGVLLPMVNGVLGLQAWLARRRILAVYDELRVLESGAVHSATAAELLHIVAQLAGLDERVGKTAWPTGCAPTVCSLRDHIAAAKARVRERAAQTPIAAVASDVLPATPMVAA